MDWLHGAWAVFLKDLRLELRTRYAVNALLLFVASSLLLVVFAVGGTGVSPEVAAALLWTVIVFAAAVGLGRAFVAEEERGTVLLLRMHLRGSMVYGGKLLFNVLLVGVMNALAAVGFVVVLGLSVAAPGLLALTLVLGALGLAGATTLLSALIARTSSRGPLLAVLAFPLLVPLLLSAVRVTRRALLPPLAPWAASVDDLVALGAYAGAVITASVLLFDYVWND
ncbi:MAG: heme exporter protein CcmB [Rhodothermales bacterium]|nr:heme exporter protein CcmB [Rhodothermales bacterium]